MDFKRFYGNADCGPVKKEMVKSIVNRMRLTNKKSGMAALENAMGIFNIQGKFATSFFEGIDCAASFFKTSHQNGNSLNYLETAVWAHMLIEVSNAEELFHTFWDEGVIM